MATRAVRRRVGRMLGSLPLIAGYAIRLQIERIINRACPSRGNAHLTHGQVALVVIANRLTQPRAMYHLIHWARVWAVQEMFGVDAQRLNDDRLGRALDALAPCIDRVQGAVTAARVPSGRGAFELDLSQLDR